MRSASFKVIPLDDDSTTAYSPSYPSGQSLRSSRSFNTVCSAHTHNRYYNDNDDVELLDSDTIVEPGEWSLNIKDWIVLGSVALMLVMDGVNATVLMPIQPTLSTTLNNVPLVSTLWTQTGYLLANAVGHMFFAMGSEVVGGRGALLVLALLLSVIGTGVGCRATSLTQLLIGRLLQGLAGGGMVSLSHYLMADIIPPCQRPSASNSAFLAWVVGGFLGPIAGGIFADQLPWNWALYINFLFCAVGLVTVPLAVGFETNLGFDVRRVREMDWVSGVLVFLGVGSVLIAVNAGGTQHAWLSWQTLTPMAAGGLVIFVLVVYERVWAQNPFFGVELFNNQSTVASYIGCTLQGVLIFCQMQFFILYLLSVRGFLAAFAGLSLIGLTGVMIPTAAIEVAILRKSGSFHWTVSAGWMLVILATGCLILLNNATMVGGWALMLVTAGMGHGLLLAGYNVCLYSWTSVEHSHHAMMMHSFLRTLGMALAVPVGASILFNRVVDEVSWVGVPGDGVTTPGTLLDLVGQAAAGHLSNGERKALTLAYTLSFRFLWQFLSGLAALGGLSSFFVAKHVLGKESGCG